MFSLYLWKTVRTLLGLIKYRNSSWIRDFSLRMYSGSSDDDSIDFWSHQMQSDKKKIVFVYCFDRHKSSLTAFDRHKSSLSAFDRHKSSSNFSTRFYPWVWNSWRNGQLKRGEGRREGEEEVKATEVNPDRPGWSNPKAVLSSVISFLFIFWHFQQFCLISIHRPPPFFYS